MDSDKTSKGGVVVTAVNHIALMTADLDRLIDFYVRIFGARLTARADGEPRKGFLALTPQTSLHVFEDRTLVAKPADSPFDEGSINHFALQAPDLGAFTALRAKLIANGSANQTVSEAPGLYTMFATDPDGLLIEVLVPTEPGRAVPFPTEAFVGLGQPSTPVANQC